MVKISLAACGMLLAAGVLLCLWKSSEGRAQSLAEAGQAYFLKAQDKSLSTNSAEYLIGLSRETLLEAVKLDPSNRQAWKSLASVLSWQGDDEVADRARLILSHLDNQSPVPSVPDQPVSASRLALLLTSDSLKAE